MPGSDGFAGSLVLVLWLLGTVLFPCFYLNDAHRNGVSWHRRTVNALLLLVFWPIPALLILAGHITRRT